MKIEKFGYPKKRGDHYYFEYANKDEEILPTLPPQPEIPDLLQRPSKHLDDNNLFSIYN